MEAYKSEKWMRLMLLRRRKSPQEVADICGVSAMTIYRYMEKFRIRR